MKRMVMAAVLLAASSLSALAAEATGTIASVDIAEGTVTLEDGALFILPPSTDASSLQVGDRITVTYVETNGQALASQIELAR